jgi:uncharacterized protein
MHTQTYPVSGMHCASCSLLIERAAQNIPEIIAARVDSTTHTVEIETAHAPEAAVRALNTAIAEHGYAIGATETPLVQKTFSSAKNILIAFALFTGFLLLQKLDIINIAATETLSGSTLFLIGVAASLSSCMAVVGSLVLGLPPAQGNVRDKIHAHTSFHLSRIISFILFGALIGSLGKTLELSPTATALLHAATALFLIMLGFNMAGQCTKIFRVPTLPKRFAAHALRAHAIPAILGAATFILPCGFTQSMQLYALGTGSAWQAGYTMGMFALGTLPVLGVLSVSTIRGITTQKYWHAWRGIIGYTIVLFGLYTIYTLLALRGILPPIL